MERRLGRVTVWCTVCNTTDCPDVKAFKTGFHFINGVRVSAGICDSVKRPETGQGGAGELDARLQERRA